jgi:hypothetical protein
MRRSVEVNSKELFRFTEAMNDALLGITEFAMNGMHNTTDKDARLYYADFSTTMESFTATWQAYLTKRASFQSLMSKVEEIRKLADTFKQSKKPRVTIVEESFLPDFELEHIRPNFKILLFIMSFIMHAMVFSLQLFLVPTAMELALPVTPFPTWMVTVVVRFLINVVGMRPDMIEAMSLQTWRIQAPNQVIDPMKLSSLNPRTLLYSLTPKGLGMVSEPTKVYGVTVSLDHYWYNWSPAYIVDAMTTLVSEWGIVSPMPNAFVKAMIWAVLIIAIVGKMMGSAKNTKNFIKSVQKKLLGVVMGPHAYGDTMVQAFADRFLALPGMISQKETKRLKQVREQAEANLKNVQERMQRLLLRN